MTGTLYQLLDEHGEQLGLLHTERKYSIDFIEKYWSEYYHQFDEDIDDFVEWMNDNTMGGFERVFTEEVVILPLNELNI